MQNLLRICLIGTGIVLALAAYGVQVDELSSSPARAAAQVAVGWAFLLAGIVAWSRRPANPLGVLMVVTAFALLGRQLRYSTDPVLFTTFFAVGDLWFAMVPHAVVAYPSGHVADRLERALVKLAYATALLFPLAALLFYGGEPKLLFFDDRPRESLLLVSSQPNLVDALQKAEIVILLGILATVFFWIIGRRYLRASKRGRRILLPLLVAGAVLAGRAVIEAASTFVDRPFSYSIAFWWQVAGLSVVPLGLMFGLLRAQLAYAGLGSLVVELERTPARGLRDALARALGDPTLDVAFWLPEREAFVDAAGREVELGDDPRRAVTRVDHEGRPVAALVHDRTLLEEPDLLEAAGAAAGLALDNARLQAELQAQLLAVRDSRARIVAAADAERRRIERDLHDGAQQRLLALALNLRSAARRRNGIDPELARLLDGAVSELQGAVEELRELARGLHPTLLAEQGLEAALHALRARLPLPVDLAVDLPGRPEPAAEAAAYFVACEALTNAVKHAGAAAVSVRVAAEDGVLRVEVADDGAGGADADGSGLRGLADRVEALGGRLTVESPGGAGTRVSAELPAAAVRP